MICPKCGQKFSFLKIPQTEMSNAVSGFNCPKCGVRLKIKDIKSTNSLIMKAFLTLVSIFSAGAFIYEKYGSDAFLLFFFPGVSIAFMVFYAKTLSSAEIMTTDEKPRPSSEIMVKMEAEELADPKTRERKYDTVGGFLQTIIAMLFVYIVRVVAPSIATVRTMAYIWVFLAVLQLVIALIFAAARKAKPPAIIGIIVYNLFIIIVTLALTLKFIKF